MEKKVKSLEIIEKVLVVGIILIGIITVIDIFLPDPIFLLDEAALTAITGLLTYIASIVKRKVDDLKNGTKNNPIDTKQISEITEKLTDTAKSVKRSRGK